MAALESTWLEESSLHERGCKSGTLICNPWLCWAPALKQAYTSMSKSPEKSIRDEGEGGGVARGMMKMTFKTTEILLFGYFSGETCLTAQQN